MALRLVFLSFSQIQPDQLESLACKNLSVIKWTLQIPARQLRNLNSAHKMQGETVTVRRFSFVLTCVFQIAQNELVQEGIKQHSDQLSCEPQQRNKPLIQLSHKNCGH